MSTPELTFRLATADDAVIIAALVQSAYRGDSSRLGWTTEADLLDDQRIGADGIAEIIANPDSAVLTVVDEHFEIVGCCQIQRKPNSLAYFGLFAIRPTLQAAGIGRAVLTEAEAYARATWASTAMEMQVIAQRESLIAWYERRGYTNTGEARPFPYDVVPAGQALRDDLYFSVLTKLL